MKASTMPCKTPAKQERARKRRDVASFGLVLEVAFAEWWSDFCTMFAL
ncbi:hypothetical protein [Pseudomonas ficuserectae]|nr:hypothetical protein [Pseudomonas ficuserectae]